ncbi:MAG: hypothetical protein ACI9ON_001465 [Limisphaerales bacterium]
MGSRVAEGIIISHLPIYAVQTMGLDDTTYNDFSTIGGIMAAVLGVAISPWFDKIGSHKGFWFTCVGYVVTPMSNLNYSLGAFLYAEIAGLMNGTQVLLFAAALGATALPLWYLLVTRYMGTPQPEHNT